VGAGMGLSIGCKKSVKPKYGSENVPYCYTMIMIMSTFVQEKSLTICIGLDMVNINFFNIVCKDAETSQVKQSPNL
jgi:hypothetical protein